MNRFRFSLLPLLLVSFIPYIYSATAHAESFKTDTIASGLGVPWGMVVLPNEQLLISQREAQLSRLDLNTRKITTLSGLPNDIKVGGQGGLFDVAIAPNYNDTKWIYFSYNKDIGDKGATTLARAKLKNNALIDWQDLLVTQSITNKGVHYGGRITFDDHGHLFLSVGERGVRANAQDLTKHAGKILRLNLDGSVPNDNPFVNQANALPEIWSYGHRNPQGLFFNPDTQQLWEVEHGPRGGDEINLIVAGNNYGWPIISYGKEYYGPISVGEGTERDGMEQPVKTYIPSIATSCLIQYRGDAMPSLRNSLLVGALKAQHINQIELKNNKARDEKRILRNIDGRIRNIIQSPQGWLYVSTDDGRIVKVSPAKTN